MTKVAYGYIIGSAGTREVSPVVNKLLVIFGKGGGGLGLVQTIVLPQTLWDISRVKNTTDRKIEAVFQSGVHNVES